MQTPSRRTRSAASVGTNDVKPRGGRSERSRGDEKADISSGFHRPKLLVKPAERRRPREAGDAQASGHTAASAATLSEERDVPP